MSAPNTTTDYYEVLQVLPTASPEVIEAAYNGLMRKLGSDADPTVREGRRWVEEAYAVLGNPARRAEYDAARGLNQPKPEPAAAPVRSGGATVVRCARDPEVETALRCSRCDTPICPKCMVMTPVGARCRDCARIARSPVYTVTGASLARAVGAAVVGGTGMGLIWGFASQNIVGVQYGGIFMSLILGVALGYAFTRIMELATNRKRGPVVVGCAMGGIAMATGIQVIMVGGTVFIGSIIAAGVGLYFAYQNLR
ncbi:MAG: J domain-containing protein [Dehalococcoidia bacterium]